MHSDLSAVDHRRRPRRRGKTLDDAIFWAVVVELAENGYAKLSMESVAERARASKASLYRRWPSRVELVMDTVARMLVDPSDPPDTGSLRGDLLTLLRRGAALLAGPAGEAMRGLLGDPELARRFRDHSQGVGRAVMAEIVRGAVERGELDPACVTPRRLEAGQALLRHHFLFHGTPIPEAVVVEIVDEVVLPLLSAPPPEPSDGWE
ncbi:TetR/AcrR family transcriptional regulator [Thermobifida halotolerans]|uniref:TetR/AcrR family transcriptional regulator n=1 Tax=Thermobifida halotolerans TaxID=483545 RepID=A0A399G997_9ACTN|nr:TetR/AcrR family transcriptional regulator [Thermobifida halotolerans]UOE21036.1 TetR/AcrR family transcriptional regulator [Thermobifida halotolerans]